MKNDSPRTWDTDVLTAMMGSADPEIREQVRQEIERRCEAAREIEPLQGPDFNPDAVEGFVITNVTMGSKQVTLSLDSGRELIIEINVHDELQLRTE